MPRRSAGLLLIAAALPVLPAGAAAQSRPTYLRPAAELRLKAPDEIGLIELATRDIRMVRTERSPISDLMLRLTRDGGAIDVALQLPNDPRPTAAGALFRAEVYAVVKGRIVKDIIARCGPWRDDVSACQVDCDGGAFALRRIGPDRILTLVVGRTAAGDGDAARSGFAINSCAGATEPERVIQPSRGQQAAELRLADD